MGAALRAVSVGSGLEVSLEDGFQDELERTLDDAVSDRGDPQDTDLAVALRDLFAPVPQRPIRAGDQFVSDLLEIGLQPAVSMASNVTPSMPGDPSFFLASV
jgi:hypothetical protein